MIDLFIDMGNSRIKLAILEDDAYEYIGAYPYKSILNDGGLVEVLSTVDIVPDQVYVSSVSCNAAEHQLREAVLSLWSIFPIFLNTQINCCGLENGYDDPLKLGVDRWMALVGSHTITRKPYIVIDAGTAITLDAVHDNRHVGGFIVPGVTTMRQSLIDNTAKLSIDCNGMESVDRDETVTNILPRNTQSAICAGTLYMAASFVDSVIFDLQHEFGCLFKVYVTGGDGKQLARLINADCEYIEDLVLLGMVNVIESVKK